MLTECYYWRHMQDRIRALVVDDDADVRNLLTGVLTRSQMTVVEAASGGEAMTALGRDEFDVVCVDVRLPDHSGLDILRWARGAEINTEFIVLTGHADVDTAVEAMRLGAYDFVAKPWKNVELLEVVRKAVEKKALRRENVVLREVITRRDGLPEIVGESVEIREVLTIIGRVAASDSPVLIHGESGTGKELVARAIHLRSKRAGRPFVSVNCGALPDTLLETELFGHKKGAFTGAVAARAGLFEAADGGTLFLDEIGEMSPAMQVRLLRTLDSGEVRRVGEERTFHVSVRVVAATNKDLNQEAAEGRFRWDLFYRVSTVIVPVPPLRKRRGDIPLLVHHFIAPFVRAGKSLRFSPEAMMRLHDYEWPGNIRELRNLIERLLILHEGEEVGLAMLPREVARAVTVVDTAPEPETSSDMLPSLAQVERRHVERVLQATGWNKARAARVLEVDIKTLNKKIRDFGITRTA
jgi:DNA-binding NtrC family response regulator